MNKDTQNLPPHHMNLSNNEEDFSNIDQSRDNSTSTVKKKS